MPGIADQIRELVRSVTNLARRIRRLETLQNPLGVDRPQGGHIIQDEGTDLPDQVYLDFIGVGVTAEDDPENGATTVTIPGAVQEIIETTIGVTLDKIIIVFADGSGFNSYEPTEPNVNLVLAVASSGDLILLYSSSSSVVNAFSSPPNILYTPAAPAAKAADAVFDILLVQIAYFK